MGKRKREPEWHVLNFYCDDEDSCALTAILPGARVHVVADANDFNKKTKTGREYFDLVGKLRAQANGESNEQTKSQDGDRDSGIDVTEKESNTSSKAKQEKTEDIESRLQAWMLSPLLANYDATTTTSLKENTLQRWYHCSTQFYELSVSEQDESLEAAELESTAELEKEIENLLPAVTLPKYITDDIKSPTYEASELEVIDCSDQPPGTPYHPCRVKHSKTNKVYFLKVVDNSQPRTTKRELDVLNRITTLELNREMHVPVLEALVSFDNTPTTASGQKKIMGFLQTDIPDPTPLTHMLDTSIPQEKRDKWAKEADRMKEILHENDIVWGDAKADNFVVDENDDLWIIDFGGSYTEGWVDPELKETEEGDDMGTAKTVNALIDPVANTQDPDEEEAEEEPKKDGGRGGCKRKRRDEEEGEHDQPKKQRKGSE